MRNSNKLGPLLRQLSNLSPPQLQLLQLDLEAERRRRERTTAEQRAAEKAERLVDFIPRVSPRFLRPTHLTRLLGALEDTERRAVRAIVNLPPRHSKTETLLHFIAWRLKRRPWETIAYVTYVDKLANEKSLLARSYAETAGVELRADGARMDRWLTEQRGGVIFTSIGGSITGQGADVLIIDDPHKDRAEAESALHRDRVWNWYVGTATDRVEVGGSIIVCQTRWHPDDLTGRLLEFTPEDGVPADPWDVISLPALGDTHPDGTRTANDNGAPLWPERWTLPELLKKKLIPYEWLSKYQQDPKKRGGNVFKGVHYYDPRRIPPMVRVSIGLDLAYNEDTHACFSAVVVLGQDDDGIIYVLYVQREQMEIPQFSEIVRAQAHQYPGVHVHWHTSTTEKGTAQLLKMLGIPVKHALARADKFVRAQPLAAAWNAPNGGVRVPGGIDEDGMRIESPEWVNPYIKEMTRFTGVGDAENDQVDASASAYTPWAKAPNERRDTDDAGYSFG